MSTARKFIFHSKEKYWRYIKKDGITGGDLTPLISGSTSELSITATNTNGTNTIYNTTNSSIADVFRTISGATSTTVRYEFKKTKNILYRYGIVAHTASHMSPYNPKSWVVEGSNDNNNWENIHTVSSETSFLTGSMNYYNVITEKEFKYVRIRFLSSNGGNYIRINRILLLGRSQEGEEYWDSANEYPTNEWMESTSAIFRRNIDVNLNLMSKGNSQVGSINLRRYPKLLKISVIR